MRNKYFLDNNNHFYIELKTPEISSSHQTGSNRTHLNHWSSWFSEKWLLNMIHWLNLQRQTRFMLFTDYILNIYLIYIEHYAWQLKMDVKGSVKKIHWFISHTHNESNTETNPTYDSKRFMEFGFDLEVSYGDEGVLLWLSHFRFGSSWRKVAPHSTMICLPDSRIIHKTNMAA